jgi:hypothetical protein
LAAFVQVIRGDLHCTIGEPLRGLPELEAGVVAIGAGNAQRTVNETMASEALWAVINEEVKVEAERLVAYLALVLRAEAEGDPCTPS